MNTKDETIIIHVDSYIDKQSIDNRWDIEGVWALYGNLKNGGAEYCLQVGQTGCQSIRDEISMDIDRMKSPIPQYCLNCQPNVAYTNRFQKNICVK